MIRPLFYKKLTPRERDKQLTIQRELGLSRDDSRIVLFVALVYFSPPAGWGNTPYQRQVVLLRRAWAFVREHTPRRRYV